mmetsp:Transcript_74166/g.222906  ORF Transcript_74166/g.222906 Transcript_74166/m.222906 type:complete len:185 (+) Transcript_74166:12-566(+)
MLALLSSCSALVPSPRAPPARALAACRASPPTASVSFRRGSSGDVNPIRATMLQQLMNPLSISHERFLVAESSAGDRVGFGQIRPLGDDPALWELASIFVEEPWRSRGVGSELVRKLLTEHTSTGRSEADVYLLTLQKTSSWYTKFGFETCEPPAPMAFEVAAGGVLTRLLGESLVCMRCTSAG